MYSLFCTALVWLSAVIGIAIMRKIQPRLSLSRVRAVNPRFFSKIEGLRLFLCLVLLCVVMQYY